MKRIILCLSLFAFFGSQAQQINPVPDYVFRNQMSVGRNAVTDTAAYISIGPRYGANKGLMPPIVSDTAAITGVKRNGLLIFSVQRNNFQYWDSINSRWTSVTANVDTTIISTRAWRKKGDDSLGAVIATRTDTTLLSTRAWRKKGDDSLGAVIATRTDTTLLSTRAWRQKGLDSLAAIEIDGSGTVNYVPKFTATRTLGNSQIFDNGTNIGFGTTSPAYKYDFQASGLNVMRLKGGSANSEGAAYFITRAASSNTLFAVGDRGTIFGGKTDSLVSIYTDAGIPLTFDVAGNNRLRIFANGRVGVNTTTDAGYQFDVAGSIRNTTGANFATSSGNVGVGTTTPDPFSIGGKVLTVTGVFTRGRLQLQNSNGTEAGAIMGSLSFINGTTDVGDITVANTPTSNINGFMRFSVNGGAGLSERMRIDSAGRLGINTSSPSEIIDVNGRIRARTIDSTSSPINVLTSDVNGVIRKTAPGVLGSGTTNYVAKFTASGTVGNSQIFDDGTNVGIGIITPSYKLDVSGNLNGNNVIRNRNTNSGSSAASVIWLGNDASATLGALYVTSSTNTSGAGVSSLNLYTAGANPIGFATNNNQRMLLTSDGELLINTSTDAGDYRLQVNGNANFRDDVLIDTNLRVNRHISLDQTPKAWALGNAIEGPQGSTLFVAGGGVQTLANVYYDGSYKYSTSNPGAAMFLLQSGITFATYGSGTANGALTGANEMVYAGGELRVGIADQGTFKLQVADKSYLADEVQIASTTDLGNYKLQVTGEAIITAGIRTDAPSGGTAATWKLGTVATVSPTSPNRTIEVEIGGTTYYIHAKTTNN